MILKSRKKKKKHNNKKETLISIFRLVDWMDHRKKKRKKVMYHIRRPEMPPSKIPLKQYF